PTRNIPLNITLIASRFRRIVSTLTQPRAEARILAHEPAARGSRVVPFVHPRPTRQIAHCGVPLSSPRIEATDFASDSTRTFVAVHISSLCILAPTDYGV